MDDNTPNVDEIVSFTASADKYNKAMMFVELMDNDIPSLQLEINRNAVSEAAGPLAITAKLHRVNNLDKKITVKFTDDSDSEIHYGRNTIVMEKGVETVANPPRSSLRRRWCRRSPDGRWCPADFQFPSARYPPLR